MTDWEHKEWLDAQDAKKRASKKRREADQAPAAEEAPRRPMVDPKQKEADDNWIVLN